MMKRVRCWVWGLAFVLIGSGNSEARLASQLSLSVGEEYTDNVFFSERKQHDLITVVTPRLRLIYQPSSVSASRLTQDLRSEGLTGHNVRLLIPLSVSPGCVGSMPFSR